MTNSILIHNYRWVSDPVNSKIWKGQVISWKPSVSKEVLGPRTHGKLPTGMFPWHFDGFGTALGTSQQQIKYKCSELMHKAHCFFLGFVQISFNVFTTTLNRSLLLSVFCSSYLSILSNTAGTKLSCGNHVVSRSPCWWAACKHPVSFRAITTPDLFSMWL